MNRSVITWYSVEVLGVWLFENPSWAKNCQEICIKSYSRLSMLKKTKLCLAYRRLAWNLYIFYPKCHRILFSGLTLTLEESNRLEMIQKMYLKIILGDMYIYYDSSLEMCGLNTLHNRRTARCLQFALKCTQHSSNQKMFPLNTRTHGQALKKTGPETKSTRNQLFLSASDCWMNTSKHIQKLPDRFKLWWIVRCITIT